MSPLKELLETYGDELAVLGWIIRHAPDGDERAALQRVWEAETLPRAAPPPGRR